MLPDQHWQAGGITGIPKEDIEEEKKKSKVEIQISSS
jgi:hypothetical protein